MYRVKIVKAHKKYAVGQVVEVTPNEAHGLLDGGFAVMSKDMTEVDYTTAKKSDRIRRPRYGRLT